MVFTVEQNLFITMVYWRSGFIKGNGYWEYSRQSIHHHLLFCIQKKKWNVVFSCVIVEDWLHAF
jgi:hypothetical protein